jgi:hypothetical protein
MRSRLVRSRRAWGVLAAVLCFAVAALLLLVQPFLELEWFSWTMVCSRSGRLAGKCYAEPSLRDRLGMSGTTFDPAAPRLWFLPLIDIDEIARGEPSDSRPGCWTLYTKHGIGSANEGGSGWYQIPIRADDCWWSSRAVDQPTLPEEVARVVLDFNDFLGSTRAQFRYHPRERLWGTYLWIGRGTRAVGLIALLLAVTVLVRALAPRSVHARAD